MQALDAMQVGQCKGKAFSLFGRDKRIDIDRMNRLRALVIATTVAMGVPASGKTGEKDIGHDIHRWCCARTVAGLCISSGTIGLLSPSIRTLLDSMERDYR
jgi:hypothetical protein